MQISKLRVVKKWLQIRKDKAALRQWREMNCPVPPPSAYKHQLLQSVAHEFGVDVLVETGTHRGATLEACRKHFRLLYSIELSQSLWEDACVRFRGVEKIQLKQGDSHSILPEILLLLESPTLFWLDAHYSGTGTARSDVDTPIVSELQSIANHKIKNHVVLVDDARSFDGTNGYPELEFLKQYCAKLWPDHRFVVEHDVIQIRPSSQ